VHEQLKARHNLLENAQKSPPVLVVEKDVLLGVPPSGDVIQSAGKLDSKWSGHGERLAQENAQDKI
jgi:hypothetical protein